jgi:hypothetical protein
MALARRQSWQEHSGSEAAAVLQKWPLPPLTFGDSSNGTELLLGGCASILSSLCEVPTSSGLWLTIREPWIPTKGGAGGQYLIGQVHP